MKAGTFLAGFLIFLCVVFVRVHPDLQNKLTAQKKDIQVAWAVDWEDVTSFHADLNKIPAAFVVMAPACDIVDESSVRKHRKKILWRLDDSIRPDPWLSRFQMGDGVFVAGDHALEHPRLLRELPEVLNSKKGLFVLMEFVPNALSPAIASKASDRLIKGHILPTREMLSPQSSLWKARLVRAVEERWVRLLVVRFSPALSLEQNLDFQKSVEEELSRRGFVSGPAQPFGLWPVTSSTPFRLKMALLISFLTPLVVLAWASRSHLPIYIVFLMGSASTVLAGIVINALGSTPSAALGLDLMRGVKLQLLAPLLLAAPVLFSFEEIRNFFDMPIKMKHVLCAGAAMVILGGIYLMRSGNFPLIPVSNGERHFRDWMEHLMLARPRFKEFLIGHPLFLAGLALKRKGEHFADPARFILWIGLIGQISILNTFSHFHSPLSFGLVRTLNGIWLGCLVAVPAVLLVNSQE